MYDTAINVKSFNAWGDGIHDDTAALQRAFNAASGVEQDYPIGRPIYIPTGKYLVRETLHLQQQNSIGVFGDGMFSSALQWDGIEGGTLLSILGVRDSPFKRFALIGDRGQTTTLLKYDAEPGKIVTTANLFEQVYFYRGNYGLRAGQSHFQTDETMFNRCKWFLCNIGVSLEDQNCVFFDFYDNLFQQNGKSITAMHNDLGDVGGSFNCYTTGFEVNTDWDLEVYPSSRGCVLSGCWFERDAKVLKTRIADFCTVVEIIGCSVNEVSNPEVPFMELNSPGSIVFTGGKYVGSKLTHLPLRFIHSGPKYPEVILLGGAWDGNPFEFSNIPASNQHVIGANYDTFNLINE